MEGSKQYRKGASGIPSLRKQVEQDEWRVPGMMEVGEAGGHWGKRPSCRVQEVIHSRRWLCACVSVVGLNGSLGWGGFCRTFVS